jgi:hypothetical protein
MQPQILATKILIYQEIGRPQAVFLQPGLMCAVVANHPKRQLIEQGQSQIRVTDNTDFGAASLNQIKMTASRSAGIRAPWKP